VGLSYLLNEFIPICDKWILADNSVTPFIPVAEGDAHSLTIHDIEKYKTILRINSEYEKDLRESRKEQ